MGKLKPSKQLEQRVLGYLLEDIVMFVRTHLMPEQVFPSKDLSAWADRAGYRRTNMQDEEMEEDEEVTEEEEQKEIRLIAEAGEAGEEEDDISGQDFTDDEEEEEEEEPHPLAELANAEKDFEEVDGF